LTVDAELAARRRSDASPTDSPVASRRRCIGGAAGLFASGRDPLPESLFPRRRHGSVERDVFQPGYPLIE